MNGVHASDVIADDSHALYRALVLEHARSPRNFGALGEATHRAAGINPLCGDKLDLTLEISPEGLIAAAGFEGTGCAISIASASILTELVRGLRVSEAMELFAAFERLLEGADDEAGLADPLQALAGVRQFPSRIKCATLAWRALSSAVDDRGERIVTTE